MKQLSTLRVIPFDRYSGEFNMAADEFLLGLKGAVLRFYGWKSPTLSFGKFNQGERDIDLKICAQENINQVRRLSGGQTVLHQHELTYCFSAENAVFPSSITERYKLISHPVASALEKMGIKIQMKPLNKKLQQSTICFNEISAFEIETGGKKIVGSAQAKKKHRFIQHGSILLDMDLDLWKQIWKIDRNSTLLENRVTAVNQELGEIPDLQTLCQTLIAEFISFFNTDYEIKGFDEDELEQIHLFQTKYNLP